MQNNASLFISVQHKRMAVSLNACPVHETLTVARAFKVAVVTLPHLLSQSLSDKQNCTTYGAFIYKKKNKRPAINAGLS
jgi:hypothetical protein